MWFENLAPGNSWAALWFDHIICGECSGIRKTSGLCPACSAPFRISAFESTDIDGAKVILPMASMGAEGRYEDWMYLQMLQREWERPLSQYEPFTHLSVETRPSSNASIVLLFWSYFETKIERLLRNSMHGISMPIQNELLSRNGAISARLTKLYKLLFNTTYFEEIRSLGYDDVASMLSVVHEKRNAFAHGQPAAITDEVVTLLVSLLEKEHEAWIAAFNQHVFKRSSQ